MSSGLPALCGISVGSGEEEYLPFVESLDSDPSVKPLISPRSAHVGRESGGRGLRNQKRLAGAGQLAAGRECDRVDEVLENSIEILTKFKRRTIPCPWIECSLDLARVLIRERVHRLRTIFMPSSTRLALL